LQLGIYISNATKEVLVAIQKIKISCGVGSVPRKGKIG
jgi:hypothetical protein